MFGFIFLWFAILAVFAFIAFAFIKKYPQYGSYRNMIILALVIAFLLGAGFIAVQTR